MVNVDVAYQRPPAPDAPRSYALTAIERELEIYEQARAELAELAARLRALGDDSRRA
jgi:CHASE3 domain sensor protein